MLTDHFLFVCLLLLFLIRFFSLHVVVIVVVIIIFHFFFLLLFTIWVFLYLCLYIVRCYVADCAIARMRQSDYYILFMHSLSPPLTLSLLCRMQHAQTQQNRFDSFLLTYKRAKYIPFISTFLLCGRVFFVRLYYFLSFNYLTSFEWFA